MKPLLIRVDRCELAPDRYTVIVKRGDGAMWAGGMGLGGLRGGQAVAAFRIMVKLGVSQLVLFPVTA